MTLSITIAATYLTLRFVTPEAGSYYVVSGEPGACTVQMEASNHETGPCHVAVRLPMDAERKLFWVFFVSDSGDWQPIRDAETEKTAVGAFQGGKARPERLSKQREAVLRYD